MNHIPRDKKIRSLVSRLNKQRKAQAKKMDILCNDLVAAQRNFIKRLRTISFAANFYHAILGISDLDSLCNTAGKLVKNELPGTNVVFFLRRGDGFELHLTESDQPVTFEQQPLERSFTPELVNNVCRSNKLCALDNLLQMGLQVSPPVLNGLSAVTIPVSSRAQVSGFILIYACAKNKITSEQLNDVSAVMPGLFRAIDGCCVYSPSANQEITP
ncbi:MAG TPA: hypothetical protein VMW23_03350 [Sedimentisphaerales bacterium]|nr:hypothetical protein [Sedimentisphaerales bacterium]